MIKTLAFVLFFSSPVAWSKRFMSFNQIYGNRDECGTAALIFSVTNISTIPQTVKVKGGMQVLLLFGNHSGIGITSLGTFISGVEVRGHSGPGVTGISPAGTVTPLSGADCVGILCKGIGTGLAPAGSSSMGEHGPVLTLAPQATAFYQTERYGSGAHGQFLIQIEIAEDRGAVTASGNLLTLELTCATGLQIVGTETSTTVSINGGRPF